MKAVHFSHISLLLISFIGCSSFGIINALGQANISITVTPEYPLLNHQSIFKTGPGLGSTTQLTALATEYCYFGIGAGYHVYTGKYQSTNQSKTAHLDAGLVIPINFIKRQSLISIYFSWLQTKWIAKPSNFTSMQPELIESRWTQKGIRLSHNLFITRHWSLQTNLLIHLPWKSFPTSRQAHLGVGLSYFIGPLTREKNKKTTDAQPLPSNEP